jgi:hypothetical protein
LSDRIASYCDTGDIFCDAGSKGQLGVHESYLDVYSDDALDFILEKFDSGTNETTTSTASPMPSSTNSDSATNSVSSVSHSIVAMALLWLGLTAV